MADSYLITPEMFTDKMNILIYGDPGTGKTYLAGTAQDVPQMADVHVFNIDGGIMTLASRGDIHATDIKSIDDLEQELFKIANGDAKYKDTKTVVIDNITELQTLALEQIAMREYKDRIRKDKNYTIDEVYLEDYGVAGTRMARILRGFRDLPMHVIYIAHKKDKTKRGINGATIVEESRPNLTDKLGTAVMGYMDFVWYLYTADETVTNEDGTSTNETHRYLLTQSIGNFSAKTRGEEFAKRIGVVIKDPSMVEIMREYMNNEKEEVIYE